MERLVVAKNVRHGDILMWRGKKLVRMRKDAPHDRIAGSWRGMDQRSITINMDGERFITVLPQGLVVHGPAEVNILQRPAQRAAGSNKPKG